MTSLEAVGERAEALQHARLHGTLLHQELDAAPEAAVVELAERLRAEPDGGPVRRWYSRRGGRRSSDGVAPRSEERRVGKSVDLGGRRIIKKKKKGTNKLRDGEIERT